MAGRGEAPEGGREGPSLQELEALLDAKEREFALHMQRLREQLSQVIGHQPSRQAAAFTGWQGLAKRSTAPGELGQTWGALGQPMMGALWRNRELESENRRLRDAVARRQSQLHSLQQAASSNSGARHVLLSLDATNAWPGRGASASSDDKARSSQAAQAGLPLELSASNLSAASSSSTTGANGAGASTDLSRGNVSPAAVACTPMFGSVAPGSEIDLLPDFSVPSGPSQIQLKVVPPQAQQQQSPSAAHQQPTQPTQPPAAVQMPSQQPQQALQPQQPQQPQQQAASGARTKLQHSDTKTKLEDTLRELADNIGTTLPPKPIPPELERKDSKPSGPLLRSESFPASSISEPNHVEGCSKDVQGYGTPVVYQNWRKGHVKEGAETNSENGEPSANASAASSRAADAAT